MRYALAAILAIFVLIVGTVVLIGQISRTNNNPRTVQENGINLDDYIGKDVTLAWTHQSEVVGDDEFRAVKVTVTPSERKLEVLQGYEGSVLETKRQPNTQAAFDTFLTSLKNSGFSNKRDSRFEDERGVCPLGSRYIYELKEATSQVIRTWSTTCSTKDGTFAGVSGTVQRLFKAQITGYNSIVRDVKL